MWSFVILCVFAAVGIVAALVWQPKVAQLSTGSVITPSRALPDFSLIDVHGRNFGSADLRGSWSLMFFGYTNCPDFCPTTLAMLAALRKNLREANFAALPRVIFVSVDAQRDTPAQLAQYVPNFDPEFIGLTAADQPAIEAIARKMGVSVIIRPAAGGSYVVDHSSAIFVIDPGGKVSAILTGPFTVEALQGDLRRIIAGRA